MPLYNLLTALSESKAHRISGSISLLLLILGLYFLGSYLPFLSATEKTIPLMARVILFLILLSTQLAISLFINLRYQNSGYTFLFRDNGLKWRVTVYNDGRLNFCHIPYCEVHDMPYYLSPDGIYMCREAKFSNCNSKRLNEEEKNNMCMIAMPKAEKLTKKYKTLY